MRLCILLWWWWWGGGVCQDDASPTIVRKAILPFGRTVRLRWTRYIASMHGQHVLAFMRTNISIYRKSCKHTTVPILWLIQQLRCACWLNILFLFLLQTAWPPQEGSQPGEVHKYVVEFNTLLAWRGVLFHKRSVSCILRPSSRFKLSL